MENLQDPEFEEWLKQLLFAKVGYDEHILHYDIETIFEALDGVVVHTDRMFCVSRHGTHAMLLGETRQKAMLHYIVRMLKDDLVQALPDGNDLWFVRHGKTLGRIKNYY